MTVCVAAQVEDRSTGERTIIGACDRMITWDNIEYEPEQTKVVEVNTDSFTGVALIAGTHPDQMAICSAMKRTIADSGAQSIRAMAEAYSQSLVAFRQKRAERTVLAPLGLTYSAFFEKAASLPGEMVREIKADLENVRLDTMTIVAGVEKQGRAGLYLIDETGDVSHAHGLGFAAVGMGYWHALGEFMRVQYMRWMPLPDILWLTYCAKRKAEVAPSVGEKGTDLFMITTEGMRYFGRADKLALGLEYGRVCERERKERQRGSDLAAMLLRGELPPDLGVVRSSGIAWVDKDGKTVAIDFPEDEAS